MCEDALAEQIRCWKAGGRYGFDDFVNNLISSLESTRARVEELEQAAEGKHPASGDYVERAQFRDIIAKQAYERAAKRVLEKDMVGAGRREIAAAIRELSDE